MLSIDAVLGRREAVTPQRFLSLLSENPGDIGRVQIEPPRLGEPGFGRIVIEHNRVRFRSPFQGTPFGR